MNLDHAQEVSPQASSAQTLSRVLPRLVLAGCIVQFTSAWLYGERIVSVAAVASGEFTQRRYAVPFQYSLWLLIVTALALHVRAHGIAFFLRLKPFLPYGIACVLTGLIGFHPTGVVRPTIFWMVALLSASYVAFHMREEELTRFTVGVLSALMVGSIAAALLLPDMATHRYHRETVWAGLFVLKNQLGWIASITLVLAATLWRVLGRPLGLLALVSSTTCLWFSDSKGASVAAIVALAYVVLAAWLRRRAAKGLSLLLLLLVLVLSLLLVTLMAEQLASAFGRDLTLTGRTDIWKAYLASISQAPIFGRGPGAYTGLSPYSTPIAFRFQDIGLISTPHNLYLAVLGDSGVVGLITLCGLLGYLGVYVPLTRGGPVVTALAGVVMLSILQGMVETHDPFGAGPTWFFVPLLWMTLCASALRSAEWAADPPAGDRQAQAHARPQPSY